MGYKVDFDGLDQFSWDAFSNCEKWIQGLQSTADTTRILIETGNMAGKGADAIRNYLLNTHSLLQAMLLQLICLHRYNLLQYKVDYLSNIDESYHAVIHQDELNELKTSLIAQKEKAAEVEAELKLALRKVSDIFSVAYRTGDITVDAHDKAIERLTLLDEAIQELESKHLGDDFINTSEAISSLSALILSLTGRPREYRTDFSGNDYVKDDNVKKAIAAYQNSNMELNKDKENISDALDKENHRREVIAEEYEERSDLVKMVTVLGDVVIVGAAVAVVISTGGAATPVVVGGLSYAGMGALDHMGQTYMEDGSLKYMSSQELAAEMSQDALIGMAVNAVGGTVGDGAMKLTGKVVQNPVAQAAFGNVAGGIASRPVETVMEEAFDWELSDETLGNAAENAFDPGNIVLDAATGGAAMHAGQKIAGADDTAAKAAADGLGFGFGTGDRSVEQILENDRVWEGLEDGAIEDLTGIS